MTESGTTGVQNTCVAGGFACVDLVPDGWNGPVARRPDDTNPESPSCQGDFPQSVVSGFSSFSQPNFQCACSCGVPGGGACDPSLSVEVFPFNCPPGEFCFDANAAGCANASPAPLLTGESFFGTSTATRIRANVGAPEVALAPSCLPSTVPTIPASIESEYVELCAPVGQPEGECSEAERCTPRPASPYENAICIWTEGDVECPADVDYSQREVHFRGLQDTRECSDCECGSAQNVACSGEVGIVAWYNGFLLDPAEFWPADGSCTGIIGPNMTSNTNVNYSFQYTPEEPTTTGCNVSGGGQPSGAVSGLDPITVCCASLD